MKSLYALHYTGIGTLKFGCGFANRIRRWLLRWGDKEPLDKVASTIALKRHWHSLWRPVGQETYVLEVERRTPAAQGAQ